MPPQKNWAQAPWDAARKEITQLLSLDTLSRFRKTPEGKQAALAVVG